MAGQAVGHEDLFPGNSNPDVLCLLDHERAHPSLHGQCDQQKVASQPEKKVVQHQASISPEVLLLHYQP